MVVPVVHRERGAAKRLQARSGAAPTFPVDPPGRLVMRLPPILERSAAGRRAGQYRAAMGGPIARHGEGFAPALSRVERLRLDAPRRRSARSPPSRREGVPPSPPPRSLPFQRNHVRKAFLPEQVISPPRRAVIDPRPENPRFWVIWRGFFGTGINKGSASGCRNKGA